MGKIPSELRETIAKNIRDCRMKKFPGRGGGKKCAESFGVSPQQWSPWERGMRTPDELRLSQIADFFGVSVEFLRRSNGVRPQEASLSDASRGYGMIYDGGMRQSAAPMLREPGAPSCGGLPSLRREDSVAPLPAMGEISQEISRLQSLLATIITGICDGRYDPRSVIVLLRHINGVIEPRMREAEPRFTGVPAPVGY